MFKCLDNDAESQGLISTSAKRKFNSHAVGDGDSIIVRSYVPDKVSPFTEAKVFKNQIPFTPTQIDAVVSGTLPGLTMIVGPPGSGKTDVAVQIISNIYHNFPNQNILLITHSNQALNQLFEKIVALDINPLHLLRLGHGEDELEIEGSEGAEWGKYGRSKSYLEKRIQLLADVDKLAASLSIDGAHGNSCETAGYFYHFYIVKLITEFRKIIEDESKSVEDLLSVFPFIDFFNNVEDGLFVNKSRQEIIEKLHLCLTFIEKMFLEVENVRAFELLRTSKDRSNYLLIKEAKIIALTCTHAALKRRELVRLGFKYDNVVMEEAAQILEVETFIPLLLQSPDTDINGQEPPKSRLKRVILIGDHHQLPPVIQNSAFQKHANMEQTLFQRFIRLGVPNIQLDKQGRSRPEIANLYRWKYNNLGDLPNVCGSDVTFTLANPGFLYNFQLVDVGDFLGRGESQPMPHFFQNLGEAEFVVATFMYMRLLG